MRLSTFTPFALVVASLLFAAPAFSADYVIDTAKSHAFIQFRIKHLGFSWLHGRFNSFEGTFSYDEAAPEKSQVGVTIDVASLDTNHAERDKHLRSDDFFDVGKYPEATFTSTAYRPDGNGGGILIGDLTLRGVTRPGEVAFPVPEVHADLPQTKDFEEVVLAVQFDRRSLLFCSGNDRGEVHVDGHVGVLQRAGAQGFPLGVEGVEPALGDIVRLGRRGAGRYQKHHD